MSTPWRDDPVLKTRLHPEYPDDIQVVVHDGGPRFSSAPPEAVWVTITAQEGAAFRGTILNAPSGLRSVRQDDSILFIAPPSVPHALMVTRKYLAERVNWEIDPCNSCGFDELFDAPSDLIAKVFPDLPAGTMPEMMTSFCPLCGGVQGLTSKLGEDYEENRNGGSRPGGFIGRMLSAFKHRPG